MIFRITLISLILSPLRLLEKLIGNAVIPAKLEHDPVFIIGHWRSGTTFLHYLLSKDPQFGYLTYYHSFVPGISIIGGDWLKKILKPLLPYKRPQDNVELATDLPAEEENSVATLTECSPIHSWFFPKNRSYFHRFALMDSSSEKDIRRWKASYHQFLRKVSYLSRNRQLVIKNPFNTARIKFLLEIYPNAKFIHLYRNPTDIYPSTKLMYEKVVCTQFLQEFSTSKMEEMIIDYYKSIMRKFNLEKGLIPSENFIELAYEDFEKDPLDGMERIYGHLGFQLDPNVKSQFEAYIKDKQNYKKNIHHMRLSEIKRIRKEWAPFYQVMNYTLPEEVE